MHGADECDISFAVDLCAQIDESDARPCWLNRSETTAAPSSWRRFDGVEAVIQQWWRRAATIDLCTAFTSRRVTVCGCRRAEAALSSSNALHARAMLLRNDAAKRQRADQSRRDCRKPLLALLTTSTLTRAAGKLGVFCKVKYVKPASYLQLFKGRAPGIRTN